VIGDYGNNEFLGNRDILGLSQNQCIGNDEYKYWIRFKEQRLDRQFIRSNSKL
jgi:hypothetical protein